MDLTTSRYERREGPPTHSCQPPGWWRRWRDGVRDGAIWRCACGERFEFRPGRMVTHGIHQYGQEQAPWWHIFDAASHPPAQALLDAPIGQPPGEIKTGWSG